MRVLIADDHPVVCLGLLGIINGQPDMMVVGQARTGTQAVALARTQYRRAELKGFYDRASPLFQAFAYAAEDEKDPIYTAYLAQALIRPDTPAK